MGLVVFEPERKAIQAIREKAGMRSNSAVVRKAVRLLARAYKIPVEKRRFPQPEKPAAPHPDFQVEG